MDSQVLKPWPQFAGHGNPGPFPPSGATLIKVVGHILRRGLVQKPPISLQEGPQPRRFYGHQMRVPGSTALPLNHVRLEGGTHVAKRRRSTTILARNGLAAPQPVGFEECKPYAQSPPDRVLRTASPSGHTILLIPDDVRGCGLQ